jgi:hypothetical protein
LKRLIGYSCPHQRFASTPLPHALLGVVVTRTQVSLSSQAADAVSMLHGAEEKLLQQKTCLSTFFLTPLIFKQLKELDMKSDGYEYNYFHRRARSSTG